MVKFYDWQDIRAELNDGDTDALAGELDRTEAWVHAFRIAEDRERLELYPLQVEREGVPEVPPHRLAAPSIVDVDDALDRAERLQKLQSANRSQRSPNRAKTC